MTEKTPVEIAAEAEAAKKTAAPANRAKREAYEARQSKMRETIEELAWFDEYLAQRHGLTISDLLRSVARNFHGVSIPNYAPPSDETEKTGD